MKLTFSPEQIEWLLKESDKDNAQEALDYFVDLMRHERLNPQDIMLFINELIRKGVSYNDQL